MPISIAILIANLAATWFMMGLIWFVQVVHYPQFDGVGHLEWAAYHRRHTRLTTLVVGPPMLVELLTSLGLIWICPAAIPRILPYVGLAIVGVIWISTAFLQVPRHNQLAGGFDSHINHWLCATNWIRTIGWTLRGLLMIYLLYLVLARGQLI